MKAPNNVVGLKKTLYFKINGLERNQLPSYTRWRIVSFYLYEKSRMDKSIEKENILGVPEAGKKCGERWVETDCWWVQGPLWSEENVLKFDDGEACTTL